MFYAKSIFFPIEQISYNLLATNSFFVITNVLLYEYNSMYNCTYLEKLSESVSGSPP